MWPGLTEFEKEQRRKLAERLKDRPLPDDWRQEIGMPHFPEDRFETSKDK